MNRIQRIQSQIPAVWFPDPDAHRGAVLVLSGSEGYVPSEAPTGNRELDGLGGLADMGSGLSRRPAEAARSRGQAVWSGAGTQPFRRV